MQLVDVSLIHPFLSQIIKAQIGWGTTIANGHLEKANENACKLQTQRSWYNRALSEVSKDKANWHASADPCLLAVPPS